MVRARRNLRGGPRYRQRPVAVVRRRRRVRPAARVQRRRYSPISNVYRNPLTDWKRKTCVIYNTNTYFASNGDTINVHVFSANNLNDPDYTGVGHQPMYHDNFSALYSRYKVTMCKITVTLINTNVNTAVFKPADNTIIKQPNFAYKLFIVNETSPTDYPTIGNTLLEEGGRNIKWRYVAPALNGKLPKLKATVVAHKLQNRTFNDDTLAAAIDAGPSAGAYFIVGVCAADGTSLTDTVYANVRLKYYVTYFDRKTIQVAN